MNPKRYRERVDRDAPTGITDVDVQFAMCAVPTDLLERWAAGPWPEPHCGVCRSVDEYEARFVGFEVGAELDNVQKIIDYHDEPIRTAPRGKLWTINKEMYRRCLLVYAEAQRVLDARAASSAA